MPVACPGAPLAGPPSDFRARGGALRSLSAAVRARPPSSSSPLGSLPKIRMSPAFSFSAACAQPESDVRLHPFQTLEPVLIGVANPLTSCSPAYYV